MEYAVKATGVCKDYGSFSLKSVDLEIPKGFVTGLIGSNGAGKSTIMKCLTGAVIKDSGTVEFDDGLELKEIGLVFDECPFPQYMRCEQLDGIFTRMFDGWDGEKYFAHLQQFGIDRKKKVKDLSRGMSMKLQVAVAFSHPTKLLILDEPTAGMDPASRDEFLDSLREYMQDEEHAILISSHITTDLEKIADYVSFMKNGQILVSSGKDELEETYGLLKTGGECPIDKELVICSRHSESNTVYLINDKAGVREAYPELVVDDATLEDIMVMFARGDY